jgi:hypothetical protein
VDADRKVVGGSPLSPLPGGNGDHRDNGQLLDSVLAARRELADISLEREREALKQELAWTQIRSQR